MNDVVYLLTSDQDVCDGKWTVASNTTPVKNGNDSVCFQLNKLITGRQVNPLTPRPHVYSYKASCTRPS